MSNLCAAVHHPRVRAIVGVVLLLIAMPSVSQADAPPDSEVFAAFARQVEENFAAGESWVLGNAIDRETLLAQATIGLPAPRVVAGALAGLQARLELGRAIAADLARGGGSYRLLIVTPRQRGAQARYRWLARTGLNYHDLHLVRNAAGDVRIIDVLDHSSGLWLSEQIRRALLQLLAAEPEFAQAELSAAERARLTASSQIEKMRARWATGRFQSGEILYRALPRWVRDDLPLQLERLAAALAHSALDIEASVRQLQATHPQTSAGWLLVIREQLAREHGAAALAALDELAQLIPHDPYLDVLRAEAYLLEHRSAASQEAARRATLADTNLEPAWWALLAIALEQADHPTTLEALLAIERLGGANKLDILQRPAFAGFRASPEYARWQARQRPTPR